LRNREIGIVAFYYPGYETLFDHACRSSFLGNFYHLGPGSVKLSAPACPDVEYSFCNAEAAFQALKYWDQAKSYEYISGEEAFERKKWRRNVGKADRSYAGFGSNWAGMRAVLAAKFVSGSPAAEALIQTCDTFLLEHNVKLGRDTFWSDNCDGEGKNFLGLQLMLRRDELRNMNDETCTPSWTKFISEVCQIDLETGQYTGSNTDKSLSVWQNIVRRAARTVNDTT